MAATGGFCPLPIRLGGDAQTGWTAEQHARSAADLVAKKRTAPFCRFAWSVQPTSTPVISGYMGMNGAGSSYAPNSLQLVGNSVSIKWTPALFTDAYGVAYPFIPRHAVVSVQSASYARATFTLVANGISIQVFDAAGSAIAPPLAGSCELW
jgi:hypothetical protein